VTSSLNSSHQQTINEIQWTPKHRQMLGVAEENQLPHKTINSSFQLAIVNNKLTILWGGRLSKTI